MTRTGWLVAAAALLLVFVAPVAWQLAMTAESAEIPAAAGSAPPPAERSVSTRPAPVAPAGPWGEALTPEPPPRVVVEEPAPVTAPVRLKIPRLGVDAPLDDVALEADGSMEIPHDVHRVGWYSPGVMPAEPTGTAVLSGHVNSRAQGPGALSNLKATEPGDRITVVHEDGSESLWQVERRSNYLKTQLPIADIFTRFGDQRLVVITCGGPFDANARSHTENVVVYARPVADDAEDA